MNKIFTEKLTEKLIKSKDCIVIAGETSSGKTSLAVSISKNIPNSEILVFDSRQIYKEMNIATGKDLDSYSEKYPHLIDIVYPNEDFTVFDFKNLALKKIEELISKNKKLIITVGTGLYLRALDENLVFGPFSRKLRGILEIKTINELKKIAANLASKAELDSLDTKNRHRLIRFIEMKKLLGKTSYEVQKNLRSKNLFQQLNKEFVLLLTKKCELEARIRKRVDSFFDYGLIDETRILISKYPENLRSFSGIGYKETIDYLKGTISLCEAKERIFIRTRQYAKRQRTWFGKFFTKNRTEIHV